MAVNRSFAFSYMYDGGTIWMNKDYEFVYVATAEWDGGEKVSPEDLIGFLREYNKKESGKNRACFMLPDEEGRDYGDTVSFDENGEPLVKIHNDTLVSTHKAMCVLGLGVIGTTYAYALQKRGFKVEHLVRESKRDTAPVLLNVSLLDGRKNPKGEEVKDTYAVKLAEPGSRYEFILISVASGKLEGAIKTLRDNEIKGTLVIFCNLWDDRKYIENIVGDYPYVMAFPTAGGHLEGDHLDCVLFDHIMLESREKAGIKNYDLLVRYLELSGIKTEIPHDMVEWVWIHMAINAGVTSTAARAGKIDNPRQLALDLMSDSKALAAAVRTIRETLKVVQGRGVDLKLYKDEINAYKIPAPIAGVAMKHLFAGNELTRRIMTLHNDVNDIMYGCDCVYNEGKKQGLELPLFYTNMDKIKASLS